jgi:hypothetical protein
MPRWREREVGPGVRASSRDARAGYCRRSCRSRVGRNPISRPGTLRRWRRLPRRRAVARPPWHVTRAVRDLRQRRQHERSGPVAPRLSSRAQRAIAGRGRADGSDTDRTGGGGRVHGGVDGDHRCDCDRSGMGCGRGSRAARDAVDRRRPSERRQRAALPALSRHHALVDGLAARPAAHVRVRGSGRRAGAIPRRGRDCGGGSVGGVPARCRPSARAASGDRHRPGTRCPRVVGRIDPVGRGG